jgi:hypothetical protein
MPIKRGILMPPFVTMEKRVKAKMAGDTIVAMMAELAGRLAGRSEEERRRILDEYAPLMAMLHSKHSEALAEGAPER